MYQEKIRNILNKSGNTDIDPRHILAFILIEHPTLDGLSAKKLTEETYIGIECVRSAPAEEAEELARSYGL